jgi:hypothetical protein
MVAFSACLHRGQLTEADWLADLQNGTFARSDSSGIALRECFPTATISLLRTEKRKADVERMIDRHKEKPEVCAVLAYLEHGVRRVKSKGKLYDKADSLVAAFGALPHVAQGFLELPWRGGGRWEGSDHDQLVEGSFTLVA